MNEAATINISLLNQYESDSAIENPLAAGDPNEEQKTDLKHSAERVQNGLLCIISGIYDVK